MKNTEAVIMEYRIEWCEWTGGRQNKQKKKKTKQEKENFKMLCSNQLHDYVCI